MPFQCPRGCKSRVAVGEVVVTRQMFSNLVCLNSQAVPKIHIIKFLYAILTPKVWKWLHGFRKMCVPAIVCRFNLFIMKNL